MRNSPGIHGVKEDAACEAYLVHIANFLEVLWGLLACVQIAVTLLRCWRKLAGLHNRLCF